MAQFAVPQYIKKYESEIKYSPPGHRFLLYFKGWDIGDKKRDVLKDACSSGKWESELLEGLSLRQFENALQSDALMIAAKLTSPLATGLGNPHPVENGFSFLSPYGVPYLPGSGVKGVVRRAAEELALFDATSEWTIPLVWLLFGFEEGSAYIAGPNKKDTEPIVDEAKRWCEALQRWINENADSDPVLRSWLDAVCRDRLRKSEEVKRKPSEIIASWMGDDHKAKNVRREIHWQGLLRFWDAFPDEKARLGVDIINPHHKKYYEGKGTPHDAEQPVPIFFLVLKQGTGFRFHVETVGRGGLMESVGDWRKLLKEAFDHAFDWLGFGAKTAVGYGAMRGPTEEELQEQEEERAAKDPDVLRKKRLEEFLQTLPDAAGFPGQAAGIIEGIKAVDDPELRCSISNEIQNRFRQVVKNGIKKKKKWAIEIQAMCVGKVD